MIGEYLDQYTFEFLINRALGNVPNELDKREGSVIYDAIAPACYELAEMYMQLKQIIEQTYVMTASGSYLDLRVQEQGESLTRYPATYAIKKGVFTTEAGGPFNLTIGSRFSTISDNNTLNYQVTNVFKDELNNVVPGAYELTCETSGTEGNSYTGPLLPITFISGLATATMSDILVAARDLETDEELRLRYLARVNKKAFGGNIAQYDELVKSINGVGELQVYPVWNGGGTVKLSVIDPEYNPISPSFVNTLQTTLDPLVNTGEGLGLVPIGHKVTVVAPTTLQINITGTITLEPGYNLPMLQSSIEQAVELYFLDQRKTWGIPDNLNNYNCSIFLARVIAAILSVNGVANVTNVQLNGLSSDIILTQNSSTQELPTLGTVVLSE